MADARRRNAGHLRRAEWSAREIARRHEQAAGKPLNPVMKAAATACEFARRPAAERGSVSGIDQLDDDQLKLNSTRDGRA